MSERGQVPAHRSAARIALVIRPAEEAWSLWGKPLYETLPLFAAQADRIGVDVDTWLDDGRVTDFIAHLALARLWVQVSPERPVLVVEALGGLAALCAAGGIAPAQVIEWLGGRSEGYELSSALAALDAGGDVIDLAGRPLDPARLMRQVSQQSSDTPVALGEPLSAALRSLGVACVIDTRLDIERGVSGVPPPSTSGDDHHDEIEAILAAH